MLSYILRLLFPEICVGCGRRGNALCEKCLAKIPLCNPIGENIFAVFDYSDRLVQKSIREFKYNRNSAQARALADSALPHVQEFLFNSIQSAGDQKIIFIPIPEHRQKINERGFNQSYILAKWWAKEEKSSTMKELLIKTKNTPPQARLNKSERLRNLQNTMACPIELDPHSIYVVIDDVTTTGATFLEARRALKKSGAKKILSIALAHGYANAQI